MFYSQYSVTSPSHCTGMAYLEAEYKEKFYGYLEELGDRSFLRISGVTIGLTTACITLAFRTASAAEPLIKGFVNLFGAPFKDECSALKGVKQLFITLPNQLLDLALSPIEMIWRLAVDTFGLLLSNSTSQPMKEAKEKFNQEKTFLKLLSNPDTPWRFNTMIERYVVSLGQFIRA